MTYGEMYDEIVQNCWPGVAAIPQNMPGILRSKIRLAQRKINRDYNFWFTLTAGTINTVASQQAYDLPTDFKDIEKGWFDVDGQNYGTPVLGQLDLMDHIDRGLHTSYAETEYPTQFRIDGANIYFYPIPSEIRVFNLLYWRFLPLVPITSDALFRAFAEDDIGVYCSEAIIFHVSMQIHLMMNEWQAAAMYRDLYTEAIEGAMQEDKARRSIPEAIAPYNS